MALLVSALALNAYILQGPLVAPQVRTTTPAMLTEAQAKAAWLKKVDAPAFGAGKVAPTGGTRIKVTPSKGPTLKKIYDKQKKAAKAYAGPMVDVSPWGGPGASTGW